MKIRQVLSGAAILILGLGQMTGRAQTYYYSGPVTGYVDAELTPVGFGQGGFQAIAGTLDETLIYDSVAQTLEQTGTVTFSPFNGTFNITGSLFGDPGLDGSATLNIGDGGSVSFDHTSALTGGGMSWGLNVPVSGSGIYNSQAFSGSWDISIDLVTTLNSVNSSAIIFSEQNFPGSNGGQQVIPGTDLSTGNSDNTYEFSWNLNSVTALPVPEVNSLSLLILGLLTMALFSWKRWRTAGAQALMSNLRHK